MELAKAEPDSLPNDSGGAFAPGSVTRADLPDMPDGYKDALVRLIAIQAYGEKLAASEGVEWIRDAPGWQERRVYSKILSDEARHSAYLYKCLADIGVDEEEAMSIALGVSSRPTVPASMAGPLAINDSENDWIDICLNMMLLDRAGRHMVENYCTSSYAPFASANERILPDEGLHEGYGLTQFTLALNGGYDRDELAGKVTKWFAHGLNFFGPPKSRTHGQLREWGLKRKSNAEMREDYRSEVMQLLGDDADDLVRFQSDGFPWS